MRIAIPIKLLTLSILIAGSSAAPAIALASTTGQAHSSLRQTATAAGTETTVTSEDTAVTSKSDAAKAAHQARLTAVKLRVCQNRQKAITNIMSRIADRGQKQLNLFSNIATKTEAFYTSKGKTVSNYDALVAAVNDKKAAAQTTVDTIKTDSTGFSCDSTDPQGSIATFKAALKNEIAALKDYKTAVKNLIVGVKSAQTATTSTDTTTEAN